MGIAVLDVHTQIDGVKPGEGGAHHRALSRDTKSQLEGGGGARRGYGVCSPRRRYRSQAVLDVLRQAGPVMVTSQDQRHVSDQGPRRRSASSAKTVISQADQARRARRRADILAERYKYRGDDAAGIEPASAYIACRLVLLNEAVGQMQRPHFEAAVEQALAGKRLEHQGAEPAARPFSTVSSTSWLAANWRSKSMSSGLANLASATVVDSPKPASWSAAANIPAAARRTTATPLPSLRATSRPLPISSLVPRWAAYAGPLPRG